MIGRPVWIDARAAARWIFSTLGFTPGLVGRALDERRLDPVPWIPFSISWTKIPAIWSSVRLSSGCGRCS